MEVKIITNKENKTIGRKEITFSAFTDAGIKRGDLKAELCKTLNISPEATVILKATSGFGSKTSTGTAHSYANAEQMKKYESRRLLQRLGIIPKDEKKAAAPAAKPAAKK